MSEITRPSSKHSFAEKEKLTRSVQTGGIFGSPIDFYP